MIDCPEWIIAMLSYIEDELDRVMWNIHQTEYSSPFNNTGNAYKNKVFEVQAYSWSDENQEFNFKYKDIKIRWYKYLGRATQINRNLYAEEGITLLDECLASIRNYEKIKMKQKYGTDF